MTAGNRPAATVGVIVVDHLDTLHSDATNESTITPNTSSLVCFDGLAGGRYVAGLTWHFLINNVDQPSSLGNCIMVTAPAASSSPITVVGSADGLSATTTIAVGSARTLPHARPTRMMVPTAGDRAAL